jgi:hypothetical protein
MAKAATARPFLLVPPNRERINEGEGKNSSPLYALNPLSDSRGFLLRKRMRVLGGSRAWEIGVEKLE